VSGPRRDCERQHQGPGDGERGREGGHTAAPRRDGHRTSSRLPAAERLPQAPGQIRRPAPHRPSAGQRAAGQARTLPGAWVPGTAARCCRRRRWGRRCCRHPGRRRCPAGSDSRSAAVGRVGWSPWARWPGGDDAGDGGEPCACSPPAPASGWPHGWLPAPVMPVCAPRRGSGGRWPRCTRRRVRSARRARPPAGQASTAWELPFTF
jgi:hypothetical protein